MNLIKKFFNPKEINYTFDTIQNESTTILTTPFQPNFNFDITKTLFPFQFTYSPSQISAFFSTKNSLIQTTLDSQKNVQMKYVYKFNNLTVNFNTLVSKVEGVYSQMEVDLKNRINNFSIKSVLPTFGVGKPIYVFNGVQSINERVSLGGEVIYASERNELGYNLATRFDFKDKMVVFSMQQFNLFNISYFKRINEYLSLAWEGNVNLYSRKIGYTLGMRTESKTGRVNVNFNSDTGRVLIERKISEGIFLRLGSEIELKSWQQNIGIGLSLEN